MTRTRPFHRPVTASSRAGMALAIVIILIGLFAALCQTLTMIVAIQYRQGFEHSEQAQAARLAEAGLLRALVMRQRDPEWNGETWKPALRDGESASVVLVAIPSAKRTALEATASFTTSTGRTYKSHQTLDVPPASANAPSEGATP